MILLKHPSGLIIDISDRHFHGYTICHDGTILSKKGLPLKTELRPRRGGGADPCVRLYFRGKSKKYTLSRLMGATFLGCIDGMEMNHLDRNPLNCHIVNIEISTPSENQKHWRNDEKEKQEK